MNRLIALTLLLSTAASAQPAPEADRNRACTDRLVALQQADAASPPSDPCGMLATVIYGDIAERVARKAKRAITPADVQAHPVLGGVHGTVGQAGAVPPAVPTPLAGATGSVVSTETGAKVLAEIELNPLGLLYTDDAEKTSWASRTADAVLVVPASTNGSLEKLDYFGVRVRFNASGFANGALAMASLKQSYKELAIVAADFADRLEAVITGAPRTALCITALESEDNFNIQNHCGTDFDLEGLLPAEQKFREASAKARREADRRYLGLDLRGDFGDPRFTGLAEQRGTRLLGAVSAGQRLNEGPRYAQLRGRLGFAYTYLRDTRMTNYALDWGLGMEFGSETDARVTKGSVGLEGRAGGVDTGAGDTRYMDLRVGITVPFSAGSGISLGVTFPIIQPRDVERKPMLSINGDWELLLSSTR